MQARQGGTNLSSATKASFASGGPQQLHNAVAGSTDRPFSWERSVDATKPEPLAKFPDTGA